MKGWSATIGPKKLSIPEVKKPKIFDSDKVISGLKAGIKTGLRK